MDAHTTPARTKGIESRIPDYDVASVPTFDDALRKQASLPLRYGDGSIALLRSFDHDIRPRVERLPECCEVSTIGTVSYGPHAYPLFRVAATRNPNNPFVCISGIVHGDEEAGGKAILAFLEQRLQEYLPSFNFIAYPCVNPSGYEAASLQAMNGYFPDARVDKNTGNINRSFGGALDQQEARLIEADLGRLAKRFLFAMDMHESPPYYTDEKYSPSDAPRDCWMYETRAPGVEKIGPQLMATVPSDIKPCRWPVIYDEPSDGGVIDFCEATSAHAELCFATSLDAHLFRCYTPHSFTTETPTGWRLEKRIATHLHFLEAALRIYRSKSLS